MTTSDLTRAVAPFVLGVAVLVIIESALLRLGEPLLIPPIIFGVVLVLIGLTLPFFAWPIRKVTGHDDGKPNSQPVSPNYAIRVFLLARASALAGALFFGSGVGIALVLLAGPSAASRPIFHAICAALGGICLVVGALISERWSQIRPQLGDEDVSRESNTR